MKKKLVVDIVLCSTKKKCEYGSHCWSRIYLLKLRFSSLCKPLLFLNVRKLHQLRYLEKFVKYFFFVFVIDYKKAISV